jgi:hypothetical protein
VLFLAQQLLFIFVDILNARGIIMKVLKSISLFVVLTTSSSTFACDHFWSSVWNDVKVGTSALTFGAWKPKTCGAKNRDIIVKQVNKQSADIKKGLQVNKELILTNSENIHKLQDKIDQNQQVMMERTSSIMKQNNQIIEQNNDTQQMIVELEKKMMDKFENLEVGQSEIKGSLNELHTKMNNLTLVSFLEGAQAAIEDGTDNLIAYVNQNVSTFGHDPLYHELIITATSEMVDQNYYLTLADLRNSESPTDLIAKQKEALKLGRAYVELLETSKGPFTETLVYKQMKLEGNKSLLLAEKIHQSNLSSFLDENIKLNDAKKEELGGVDLETLKMKIESDEKFQKQLKKNPEFQEVLDNTIYASIEDYINSNLGQEKEILTSITQSKLPVEVKVDLKNFINAKKVQLVNEAEDKVQRFLASAGEIDQEIKDASETALCEEIVKAKVLTYKPELLERMLKLSYLKLAWAAINLNGDIDESLALESKIDKMLALAVEDKTLLQERQRALNKLKFVDQKSESLFLAEALPIIMEYQDKHITDESKQAYKVDKLDTHLYRMISAIDRSLPIEKDVLEAVDLYLNSQRKKAHKGLTSNRDKLAKQHLNDAIQKDLDAANEEMAALNKEILDDLQLSGCFDTVFTKADEGTCKGLDGAPLLVESDEFFKLMNNVIQSDYGQIAKYENPLLSSDIEKSISKSVGGSNHSHKANLIKGHYKEVSRWGSQKTPHNVITKVVGGKIKLKFYNVDKNQVHEEITYPLSAFKSKGNGVYSIVLSKWHMTLDTRNKTADYGSK